MCVFMNSECYLCAIRCGKGNAVLSEHGFFSLMAGLVLEMSVYIAFLWRQSGVGCFHSVKDRTYHPGGLPVWLHSQADMIDDWAPHTDHVALLRTTTHGYQGVMWQCEHTGNLILWIWLQSSLDTAWTKESRGLDHPPCSSVWAWGTHDYQNTGVKRKYPVKEDSYEWWHEGRVLAQHQPTSASGPSLVSGIY